VCILQFCASRAPLIKMNDLYWVVLRILLTHVGRSHADGTRQFEMTLFNRVQNKHRLPRNVLVPFLDTVYGGSLVQRCEEAAALVVASSARTRCPVCRNDLTHVVVDWIREQRSDDASRVLDLRTDEQSTFARDIIALPEEERVSYEI